MSTSREVNNETMAAVAEHDILRMQDIAIPNNTKESYEIRNKCFQT